ncbi:FAD-linked oxidase C-terminal domain-containing protein [Rugosimonospora acidiphila]|uniref:FAD-linked oxidase C-terminal domain-containing protein n=1 Tax=Rugosimonospora acidiphila TaxID=556531 RepID=A0ABP9SRT2_9ACTN
MLSSSDTVGRLTRAVGAGLVIDDPDILPSYARDEAQWAPHGTPLAVVRPRTTDEVRAVVRVCGELGVPVVARGAGTGLSGGANAVDGCVVVSLAGMASILRIDPDDKIAVVQPGVVNDDLRAAAAKLGLWYPPDPASAPWSTIGGNVATNAGGICCVKYGVTRDYVLGVEVVLADGQAVRLGRRTAKGVAGYDLCGLFVGSEGTLGIITEVTVRLRSARPAEQTIVGYFDSLAAAGRAVSLIGASDVVPSALELMDRHSLRAVDDWKHLGLTDGANVLLLGRTDAPGEAGDAEAERILDCFRRAGATDSGRSSDEAEADALFAARRLVYPALERLGPVLTEDVCVPRSRVPEMLERIEAAALAHDTTIANVAHAGDGNLHPAILTRAGDEGSRLRAQRVFDIILDDAIALGGTVTGEHGVGLLKMRGLRDEVGPAVLDLHRSVKAALDPHGIFNPGKVISLEPAARP